jgi:5'-methylthioadenosine phosphorylase
LLYEITHFLYKYFVITILLKQGNLFYLMVKIGIIGGSGLDDPNLLENFELIDIITPFGHPSSSITLGKLNGVDVAILARHGKKHQITPSNVNYRANIWALKELGCTHILATTAVGSLREDIMPGHLVFPDQFIDRTTKRMQSFYDKNRVCHIPIAEPFCSKLRTLLGESATALGIIAHRSGTVITIEGPRFSTKAESHLFRSWNAHIINMSSVPEVVLAREAGLCYAVIAMSTDYDSWRENTQHVTINEILKVMHENAEKVKMLIKDVLPKIQDSGCECKEFIKTALI